MPRMMGPKTRIGKGTAVGATLLAILAVEEGVRTKAYLDIAGIPTVCAGETHMVKLGMEFTVEECMAMLQKSAEKHESGVIACVHNWRDVPDKVWIAVNSLAYNIGVGAYCRSTSAKRLREGNWAAACNAILPWNKARVNGTLRVVKGLDNRRKREHAICMEGVRA